jgi:hypothetical protein
VNKQIRIASTGNIKAHKKKEIGSRMSSDIQPLNFWSRIEFSSGLITSKIRLEKKDFVFLVV